MKKVNEYLEMMQDMRWLSDRTITIRELHLRIFFSFIGKRALKSITLPQIRDYINFLKVKDRWMHSRYHYKGNGKLSLMTIQNYISSLRHFFKWSMSMWYAQRIDPSLIQSPKVNRTEINSLTDDELIKILKAPLIVEEREDIKYRNFLLILVGYLLGLRIQEALNLTFDDLLSKDQIVLINWKGRKKRKLFVPDIIQKVALEFQKMRGWFATVQRKNKRFGKDYMYERTVQDQQPNLVFTCLDRVKYGTPLKRPSTSQFFRRYEDAMGLTKRVTYHRLRHTFGRHLLNNNVDLYTLQKMLGHETILATQYYVSPNQEKVREAQITLLPKLQLANNINIDILQAIRF